MIATGWGRIINIASLQSVRAFGNSGALRRVEGRRHAAHARAGRGAGRSTASPPTRSRPGFFATALTAPVVDDPARWEAMAERTFVGRNGELDDLRGTAVFLASRASDYVTGQTIFVDGGFSAG